MNIDDFKTFIRTIPDIREEVDDGHYTWQQLYEYYILYGENDKIWEPYKKTHSDLYFFLDRLKIFEEKACGQNFDGLQQ
ncbi:MAG: YlbD family protein, partial [Erysipelotrichaceae bacterium]|nr:YlbD family protein [Erysipelotrichaceae bacterium]